MEFERGEKFDRISGARSLVKLMKILGLWQWKKRDTSKQMRKIYSLLHFIQKIMIHLPISFTFFTLVWLGVFKSEDLNQASDVLYMAFTQTAVIVKILNIWYYSDKAWEFLNELIYSKEYVLLHPEEIAMWQRKQKPFRNVVFIFLFTGIFSGVAAFVGVLFLEEYLLPFSYWVPFEWHTNHRNYWIAYFYNMSGIYLTCFTNVCNDMMGCYMMFHLSLLYKVMGFRLARLKAIKEEDAVVELRKIFRFHKNIKRLTRECETVVSWQVLSQIILSALILCFCGYRIIKINILQNLGQFFAMLQFMSCMILEVYLPCYYANELTLYSSELCNQIYSSDWLEFSVPTRKLIFLYMEFIKHPEIITAANYFDVGLPIFTKVMNNAYRVFAVLMNVEN